MKSATLWCYTIGVGNPNPHSDADIKYIAARQRSTSAHTVALYNKCPKSYKMAYD